MSLSVCFQWLLLLLRRGRCFVGNCLLLGIAWGFCSYMGGCCCRNPMQCPVKGNKREYTIAWDIIRQIPTRGTGPRKCRLCLEEKLLILKGRRKNILNKRSELFNKCRHANKHLTWAHVTCK